MLTCDRLIGRMLHQPILSKKPDPRQTTPFGSAIVLEAEKMAQSLLAFPSSPIFGRGGYAGED
jgi:hypothetical protein